ncbi:class I SAM-dependent methyltransferase [Thermoactinomyces mirandus]|uniref:Class I SAM-dependent methyltransferase n=1 Tax=Thermoactinomyces mirandus TaxID=2756294 RepID=A0A7W2AR98_9BACL|nr:class I SAM-dependent methyltransferase [Thermoactinomyces mirandus]MBA4602764.1 class I SAM-dependent methyltransferase [Thermoactinomyces mirandus]
MPQWYEESFGKDYLLVYKHRSQQDASREVEQVARWLALKDNDLILDLCCGMGRHTISLVRRGYRVVGLDLSKVLLEKALEKSNGLAIPYIQADMRNLPLMDGSFDVVLNLFTSFGYFRDDRDNERVLSEIARVLKPDGRFLIDFLNRNSVIKKLVPESEREVDGSQIKEKRRIEGDFVCKTIEIEDEQGKRIYQERVKMYDLNHLIRMLETYSLQAKEIYANFAGEPYHPDGERVIIMGCVKK